MRGQSIHERVTMVFPGALGDFLLALPTLRALRARHPDAHCTIVVSEPLRPLAALTRCADATASVDGPEIARLLGSGERPAWLPGGVVVYSWLGATDPEMRASLASGASTARFFVVERAVRGPQAAVAYARAAGVDDALDGLVAAGRIDPPRSARLDALGLSGAVLALHAGAGATAKRWDFEGFAAVAQWWRTIGPVVTIAGPAERGEAPPEGAVAVADWPLPDVAAVLARAALYVGNDSGITHLAGAVGARGVALYGPTDPGRWAPLGGPQPLRAATGRLGLRDLPADLVLARCREVAADGGSAGGSGTSRATSP